MAEEGFEAGCYDFAYLPVNFATRTCLGYALVNFTSEEMACRFAKHFEGFTQWNLEGCAEQVCEIVVEGLQHGVAASIKCYRNSQVMHESVPDEFKPALFENGERKAFPEPTKEITAPKAMGN